MSTISVAGVYDGMTPQEYHSDPVLGGSISSSIARAILPPGSPAKWNAKRRFDDEPTDAMDLGSAAHAYVLGVGRRVIDVEHDDWRTNDAKAKRAAARAEGNIALRSKDITRAQKMAQAVRDHPTAGPLFAPGNGVAERVIVWRDAETGVWCRAMLDWSSHSASGRYIVTDYKTTGSADKRSFEGHAAGLGYHQQLAFYLDAVKAVGLHDDPGGILVAQETDWPYYLAVFQPDQDAISRGRDRNRRALELWAECQATETWPGYPAEVQTMSLPTWVAYRDAEEAFAS